MAQQQPTNVLFDKPMDNSQDELSQQLREATEAKEKLEESVDGLEGRLSIAEQEKLQLQKVNIHVYCTELYIIILSFEVFSLPKWQSC